MGGTSEFDRNGILKIAVNKNWVLNFLKVVFGHGSCFAWTVYTAIVSCLVGAAFYAASTISSCLVVSWMIYDMIC